MNKKYRQPILRHGKTSALVAAAIGATFPGTATAIPIDVGNPDFDLRWDNSLRYNLGIRVKNCDVNICGNDAGAGDVTAYQSDRKFAKSGDITTDRIDLLSEFDLIYKRSFGVRFSGSAWYDAAYDNKLPTDTALDASGYGQGAGTGGGRYTGFTKHWNFGPSAELLDAFLFAKIDLGDVPVNVKLGQHDIYWGESLFSFVGGVAYNQGPVDFRKALADPGVEAKEVFLPLNQLSFSAQATPELTFMGQYYLDWKPTRLPDGGTYFGAADGLSIGGGGSVFGTPLNISGNPRTRRGDFGIAAKWGPQWLDGTMGFYYREFTNKFPQLVLNSFTVVPDVGAAPTAFGLDYSSTKRERLFGYSLSKEIGGISFGMDTTYRPNAVLQARPFATYAPPGGDPSAYVPTGNIATVLVNAIKLFGKTPLFDMAPLTAEINYSRLQKVTANASNYNGQGYACAASADPTMHGCPTKDELAIAAMFEPKWFQVWPSVDLSMPLFYNIGLKGNSPILFGDNKGQGNWSVGVTADIETKYNISLKYNGFNARHGEDQLGASSENNSALGKYWDRDWVSLTIKAAF